MKVKKEKDHFTDKDSDRYEINIKSLGSKKSSTRFSK